MAAAAMSCSAFAGPLCKSGVGRTCTLYTKYSEDGDVVYEGLSEGQLLNSLIDQADLDCGDTGDRRLRAYRELRDTASSHWWQTTFDLKHRSLPALPMLIYFLYVGLFVFVTVGVYPHIFVDCRGQKCLLYNLSVPVQLVTGAMFFLLTFRTDLCYSRWWEGRVHWKLLDIATTNIVLNSIMAMGNNNLTKAVARWAIAYPLIVKAHIRKDGDKKLRDGLRKVLVEGEIVNVMRSRHRPNHVLTQMTCIVQQAVDTQAMTLMWMSQLTSDISNLQLYFAGVDRIAGSPMPFAYTSHSRTFMMIWLLAVPLSIVHDLEWLTIPVSVLIGYCILGIEGIADEIENPFGKDINDLDLDAIVRSCTGGLLQCVDTIESIEDDVALWGRRLKAKAMGHWVGEKGTSYMAKATARARKRKLMLSKHGKNPVCA
ncbi:unnamed protein product [Ostreobium quekettii]|uniref:Bestrophin/UPF0187 n=1 Tax=Ostreobium quekettii TaxID=121088 RepID=A0A8S1INS9_9CHLO|nr:unnamed protein product [Ostreobium quekettii]|eukprot:evm.model.scf_255EXC.4 EVM.evm.TU.scf_255EXC.4   scf_255EXC:40884-47329(-)